LRERKEQGFRMLGLGMDAGLLLRSLADSLETVDREATLSASLTIADKRQG
jgi:hypothetical protein